MGAERIAERATAPRHRSATALIERARGSGPSAPADRILQLQRQVGNRAVRQLIAQRAKTGAAQPRPVQRAASHPENSPVKTLHPSGTLSEEEWAKAHQAAVGRPSVAAYGPLFRDIAVTAGMAELGASFVPSTVPVTDGKTAKPGLNMTLNTSDGPGHTAWVGKDGTYGIPFALDGKSAPVVAVAMVLSPRALTADKGLSLRTVRHEMVHVRHKLKVLEAVKLWQSSPGRRRPPFDEWLRQQGSKRRAPMSALDVALIGKGAKDAAANTEVLAYVEGFTNDYHRRPATAGQAGSAFLELLGVVETSKLFTWTQADAVVQEEALTRLREYHATLDRDHQRLWSQWVGDQRAKAAGDKTGRLDFLTRLATFVK